MLFGLNRGTALLLNEYSDLSPSLANLANRTALVKKSKKPDEELMSDADFIDLIYKLLSRQTQ